MTDAELGLLMEDHGLRPTEAGCLRVVAELTTRGRLDEARRCARSYLMVDPNSVDITALLERLSAPAPPASLRGADPYYTVARAEAYARVGRQDLAARTYRRLLFDHPGELGILARLEQLGQQVRPHSSRRPRPVLVADWGEEVTVKVGRRR